METVPPLEPSSRVVAARDQVSADLDGDAVILNLADGIYYGLDAVGAPVWALMAEPRTVAELRDAVMAEFEVDAPIAEHDLLELLRDMAARGLVEVRA